MEIRKIKQVFGGVVILSAALFVSNVTAEGVVVEDVNFDSIPDVVVSGEDGQLTTFLGKGDGTFGKALESGKKRVNTPLSIPEGLPSDTQAIVAITSDGRLELRGARGEPLPECYICTPALEKKYGDTCKQAPDKAQICGALPVMQVREMINLNILHLKGSDCWFSWPSGNRLNWWPAGCTPGSH